MERWINKDDKYQHLVSNSNGLYVDGKCVCDKPSIFMVYLFEKYMLDNKQFSANHNQSAS
jgi:hypothetical protein